jgi:membrane-anchored glycerophosphoryl diester phosphodiesterase (GDPDase)
VLGRLGDLLLAGLRVLIPVLLLSVTIVGIPFAIYLSVRWAFVSQAVVIENQSPREAVSLSSRIVEGHWWRTFGIILVIVLLSSIVSGVVSLVLSPVAIVAATLANSVVAVVVTPFAAGANTLLFFDLQSRESERVSIA